MNLAYSKVQMSMIDGLVKSLRKDKSIEFSEKDHFFISEENFKDLVEKINKEHDEKISAIRYNKLIGQKKRRR